MQIAICPSSIGGIIKAPSSKSLVQRSLAAAFLSKKKCYIHYQTLSNDDKAVLNIIQNLGAVVEYINDNTLYINSEKKYSINKNIHCGESGLAARMFISIAALYNDAIQITGEKTLLKRPMHFFDDIFSYLQVHIKTNNGYLPVTVKGPLQPTNIEIDGSISSQFLTGLLFAYSAANASNVSIKVHNLNSKPYIDLTLKVMKQFGLKCPINRNYNEFYFDNSIVNNQLSIVNYQVEGDWSSAAFLLVAGAIAGNVTVTGLNIHSLQADKSIIDLLKRVGANIVMDDNQIAVSHHQLKNFSFDATDCPDLFPPLVTLAAYCKGTSIIKGVKRLKHKESNRAVALQQQFGKLGIEINIIDDEMRIVSNGMVNGGEVHSQGDHRIAMACAVAPLKANDSIIINESQVIEKSYPNFYEDLQRLGASIIGG